MWPFSRRKPIDPILAEAYKLGSRTMIDPSRIYFWAVSHQVDLKVEKKRLLKDGLLEHCVFTDTDIDTANEN